MPVVRQKKNLRRNQEKTLLSKIFEERYDFDYISLLFFDNMAEIKNFNDLNAAMHNPQYDITNYPIAKCRCGCDMFIPAMVIRNVPGLIAGVPSVENVPVPAHKVFRCANCGEMLQADREMIEEIERKSQEAKKFNEKSSSGLIL